MTQPQRQAQTTPEIVDNDPRQRRALHIAAIAALVVLLGTWLLFRYWQAHANPYDLLHRMYGLVYLIGIGLLAVAWHAVRYARRILACDRYPPPGGWVLGPTRVLRGDAARARARQVIASAVVLALLGGYALYLPHSITAMVGRPQPILVDLQSPASPTTALPAHAPRQTPAPATTPPAASGNKPRN